MALKPNSQECLALQPESLASEANYSGVSGFLKCKLQVSVFTKMKPESLASKPDLQLHMTA